MFYLEQNNKNYRKTKFVDYIDQFEYKLLYSKHYISKILVDFLLNLLRNWSQVIIRI